MAKKTNSALFSALLYIVLGILLIVFKSQTLNWAMTIASVVFIVSGVLDIIKKNFASGGVSLVIGIAILVLSWRGLATKIVLIVLGVLLAIKGLVALIDTLKRKNASTLAVIFAILTVIVGLAIAFGNGVDLIIIICGVFLLVDGLLGLLSAVRK